MKLDARKMEWIRAPKECLVTENTVEIVTEPFTDLWQRTYYHFRNDSAPVLLFKTEEQFFSFVVKTDFDTHVRFDQSGIIMYLDSDNWLNASVKTIWFRFSRREDDFCVENSFNGASFKQMRICHMFNAGKEICFGIYACSPENSSFKAVFTDMELTECKWLAHDGQQPDGNM